MGDLGETMRQAGRWHLSGTLLPSGEHADVWICDGVVRAEPVADAVTLSTDGWIMPGLVDAHCHVGLDPHGPIPDDASEEQALAERSAGALLLRDAGSPADTRWIQHRHDLPELIRAGQHIARPKRYVRNYAAEIEPADLVAEVETQAANGDGWVKLVGDWIDREVGDLTPLWPVDVAQAAIERAHELGARVTAHCFGEQSVAELVAAGIDGIEHGTGVEPDTIALMAERQVALVPTLLNLENFPGFADAGEAKFPAYAAHMRSLFATRHQRLRDAFDAGVPLYAGTDAGGSLPHGLIGREVAAMAELFGVEYALGAGAWRAREWLGRPSALTGDGVVDGAPADLVVFGADPRADVGALSHPQHVILRGTVQAGPA